jgi:ribosome-binding protein aMBF1 (putative translation factor)
MRFCLRRAHSKLGFASKARKLDPKVGPRVSSQTRQFSPAKTDGLRYISNVGQESGRRPKFDPEQPNPGARTPTEERPDEHRSFNVIVGEAIRRCRQEHGWTQAFLAEQAGLSPNYIARLERGELGPSLFVANRICGALAIELEVLVTPGTGTSTTQTKRTTMKRRALAG